MTIRVEVHGDSLIDMADDITDEEKPRVRKIVREASTMLRARMQRILRARSGEPSAPGQAPAEQTGELANSIREIGTTVRQNIVRGGVEVGKEEDIEKVQSLEFGAVGPDARILAARPFMRPAEAAVEARVSRLAE